MNRGYTVPSQHVLFESRTVWAALTDDTPLAVRFGVGLSLLNWLFFLGHIDETEAVFQNLEGATCDQPPDSAVRLLIATHRELANLRRGQLGNWENLEPRWGMVFAGVHQWFRRWRSMQSKGHSLSSKGKRGATGARSRSASILLQPQTSTHVHVITIKNAAFFAWLAGDSEAFDLVDRLRQPLQAWILSNAPFPWVARRNACSSQPPLEARTSIYPRVRVACRCRARKGPRSTEHSARAAIDAAAQDGQPWIEPRLGGAGACRYIVAIQCI